jgi:hypothetical protein
MARRLLFTWDPPCVAGVDVGNVNMFAQYHGTCLQCLALPGTELGQQAEQLGEELPKL